VNDSDSKQYLAGFAEAMREGFKRDRGRIADVMIKTRPAGSNVSESA
jgi:hypothetical protein